MIISQPVRSPLKLILGVWLGLTACTSTAQKEVQNPTGSMVKQASPSSDQPRAYDCAGKNQTGKGTERSDCLPNRGDEAARDTLKGSGGSGF